MYKPATPEACQLFHEGAVTLAQVEANGIRIDEDYLDRAIEKTKAKIVTLKQRLQEDSVYKQWKRVYGLKASLGSKTQLAHVLFGLLKYPCERLTASGRPSMEAEDLQRIDLPFVQTYLRIQKLEKAEGTFLKGIKKEVCQGFLHAFYNLNIAESFRSSSDTPNFQNWPVRDPMIAKLIRSAFVAREGFQLVENDFKGSEVVVSACYNKDPTLIKYITDPTKDMHRDMAAQCFMLDPADVSKLARYCGKNMFVFPAFYGSFYLNCAPDLWDAIDKFKLEGPQGIPLKEHLLKQGIKRLGDLDLKSGTKKGTFEHHIKGVDEDFWKRRFLVYDRWKRKYYNQYLEEGGFTTLTGFRVEGVYNKKQVNNYPIQGSSFHCLLWVLIRLNRRLAKYKMKSRIVGQIHDSILGDVHPKELKVYLEMVKELVEVELLKAWKWIIVPMTVEAELCPVGGSWYDKKEIQI